MALDFLSIGSTPYGEPCLQVGHCSTKQQQAECLVFLHQIERYYPTPEGARLRVKGNQHDFGTYYEVNTYYDPDDEKQVNWALAVEGDELGMLEVWDEEAHKEIQSYIDSGTLPANYEEAVL